MDRQKSQFKKDVTLLATWSPVTKLGQYVKRTYNTAQSVELKQLLRKKYHIREPQIVDLLEPEMNYTVAGVERICYSVTAGKKYRFKVIVVGGNSKGVIGIGVGKDAIKKNAYNKAVKQCKKRLISVQPTVACRASIKTGATRVSVVPLSFGAGVVASFRGKLYCNLAGLKDIRIATGSKGRSTKGRVKAIENYYQSLHRAIGQIYDA